MPKVLVVDDGLTVRRVVDPPTIADWASLSIFIVTHQPSRSRPVSVMGCRSLSVLERLVTMVFSDLVFFWTLASGLRWHAACAALMEGG